MLATEVIYEAENGLLTEVDVATASNPASVAAVKSTAASPLRAQWPAERAELAAQVASADAAYQRHPGSKEWEGYIASDACKAMMLRLRTVVYDGINWALARHWNHLWPGKEVKVLVRDFKAKASAQIVIPYLLTPSETSPLHGYVISLESNSANWKRLYYENLKATDSRFVVGRPMIFLSWDKVRPWSIFIPGQGYWQLDGFQYKDEAGKVWNSGEVISKVYYENLQKPELENDFQAFNSSFARWTERGALYNELTRLQRQLITLNKKIAAWSKVSLPESQLVALMRRAEMFAKGDPAAPRGLLLTGPSGTGKTLIASSVAASLNADFQKLSLPDLKQSNLGASGQRVREIWNHARKNQPAVIFLDECEGVFGQRGAATTDVVANEIVQAFLVEWDGRRDSRIWVIGATNRRDLIDDAIISRFGWEMVIGLPSSDERKGILEREMQAVAPGCTVPDEMASLTQGMSGRDLAHLASHIRTLAYPGIPTEEHFLEAVKVSRKAHNTKVDQASWDTLVLNPRVLQQLKLTCS